ncbi:hypothetical protein [Ensifer sp.]|uniref:hypothetical protein n=1 Tax=Ensifer sp. TaxID=1872086 RepID=UPI00289A1744|nr:hypothetical protein [Ensifer sp.]
MPKIAPPKLPACHPDRGSQCQKALETEFQLLACRAEAAGWSPEEVAAALIDLADNHFLSMDTGEEMFELGAGVVLIARKRH